jgi:hypothetical protein
MMMCVTTINYAMVINGKLCGHIIPEHGLRQTTFISYFSWLFSFGSAGDMSQCLQPIENQVTTEMNVDLLKMFTWEEVYWALHHRGEQIHRLPTIDRVPTMTDRHQQEDGR